MKLKTIGVALLLGAAFVVLGLVHIDELVLPWPVTAFAAVQALWWLLAGLVLIFRSGRIAKGLEETRL